jgi:hypothetical protein
VDFKGEIESRGNQYLYDIESVIVAKDEETAKGLIVYNT